MCVTQYEKCVARYWYGHLLVVGVMGVGKRERDGENASKPLDFSSISFWPIDNSTFLYNTTFNFLIMSIYSSIFICQLNQEIKNGPLILILILIWSEKSILVFMSLMALNPHNIDLAIISQFVNVSKIFHSSYFKCAFITLLFHTHHFNLWVIDQIRLEKRRKNQ